MPSCPRKMARSNATIFFLSLTCGAAEGAAPGIGPYAPVGAVVDAPVAAAGAPQPAHTAEPGAIGCPQLAQKPVPSPFVPRRQRKKRGRHLTALRIFYKTYIHFLLFFIVFVQRC